MQFVTDKRDIIFNSNCHRTVSTHSAGCLQFYMPVDRLLYRDKALFVLFPLIPTRLRYPSFHNYQFYQSIITFQYFNYMSYLRPCHSILLQKSRSHYLFGHKQNFGLVIIITITCYTVFLLICVNNFHLLDKIKELDLDSVDFTSLHLLVRAIFTHVDVYSRQVVAAYAY